jgi:phosphomethylpyrimidine synthase
MPAVSERTAWDFMPPDWTRRSDGSWCAPEGFRPVTQLEFARLRIVTPEMRRVAEREPHLSAEQVRDEVAAGRMVIPANRAHLAKGLDPMCIGRASRTKVNANMGASPLASSADEEIDKLRWAERWGADTVMDLSTGGNSIRAGDREERARPISTVDLLDDHRPPTGTRQAPPSTLEHQARQGVDYFTIPRACCATTCRS